jgi:membrane-anchored protein YejM (alkaline phosphatase superfamily)
MRKEGREAHFGTLFRFLAANFVLSLVVNYSYILMSPAVESGLGRLFIHAALFSNLIIIYFVLAGLLSLVVLATGRTGVVLTALVLAMTALHVLNVADITVFRIFRYHINSMVLVLLLNEGAGESLHPGARTLLTAFLIAGGIAALETWLVRFCHGRLRRLPATRKALKACLVLSLFFIAVDKSIYAVSDLYDVREVVRSYRIFPLYRGFTAKRFARRVFGFDHGRRDGAPGTGGHTSLSYPLAPLERGPSKGRPNIIWILIDSWRFDMLSPETTPNIAEFSKGALVFANHHSGGNATRFGLFSLLYGVYGSYWKPFLAERQSPVLLDELTKCGYEFRILSSTGLSNPEFRKTAFVKLAPYISDKLPGNGSAQRDPELARAFIRWLDGRRSADPFFAFLFFDAPHGPSASPPGFERYKPSIRSTNYVTAGRKDRVAHFNSYRNAILFDDALVGTILAEVRRRGLDKNSIILITGDHGEEFYETGFWGHTSSFSRYQTQVPLVLSVPGVPHRVISTLTSHVDVVPTMLGLLGYTTPPERYSHGRSLLDTPGHAFVVSSGWDECAIIDGEHMIVLSLEPCGMGGYEVRSGGDYRIVPDERAVFRRKQGEIGAAMRGMREMLR